MTALTLVAVLVILLSGAAFGVIGMSVGLLWLLDRWEDRGGDDF
ncbi:hypothetical protein ACFVUS_12625 [Nocardia sp. NPDC058058]